MQQQQQQQQESRPRSSGRVRARSTAATIAHLCLCLAARPLCCVARADGHSDAWFTPTTPAFFKNVDRARRETQGNAGSMFYGREYYFQLDQEAAPLWCETNQEGTKGQRRKRRGERGMEGRGAERPLTLRPFLSLLFVRVPSCPCRYHDHAMGVTRLNVYSGLQGFFFVRDERERALQRSGALPSGRFERALLLQDKWFRLDGSQAGQLDYNLYNEHELYANYRSGHGTETARAAARSTAKSQPNCICGVVPVCNVGLTYGRLSVPLVPLCAGGAAW